VLGLADERDHAVDEVDDGGDDEGAGEHHGHRQHRAGAGRAGGDDEQPDAVGGREGAEVAGGVRPAALLVAEDQRRQREGDDLDGDDEQQRPHDAPRRGPVGERDGLADAVRQIGELGGHAEPLTGSGGNGGRREGPARRAALEVGGDQRAVDARVLAVEARRDRVAPAVAVHASKVARSRRAVPGLARRHRGTMMAA